MSNTQTNTVTNKVAKVSKVAPKKAAKKAAPGKKAVKKEVVKVKKSLEERQTALLENQNKTSFDFIKLANVTDKLDNKSISKVYSNVIASAYINDIIGKSLIPSFKDFAAKMPIKTYYSNWDGYKCLLSFNALYQAAKKVSKQNKNIAAI